MHLGIWEYSSGIINIFKRVNVGHFKFLSLKLFSLL